MRTRLLISGSTLACLALACSGKVDDEARQPARGVSGTGGIEQTGDTSPVPVSGGAAATSAGGAHTGGASAAGMGGSSGGGSATVQSSTHPPDDLDAGCAREVDLGSWLPSCMFELSPALGSIDPDRTNVQYTSGNGGQSTLSRTSTGTAASCDATKYEWCFDDPVVPTHIQLCQSSCTALQRDPAASIQLMLGCRGIPHVN